MTEGHGSRHYFPRVAQDGLILYYDPEHPLSWPDNYKTDGARVFDLSMKSKTGRLVRSSYDNYSKAYIIDGSYSRFTNQYIQVDKNVGQLQFTQDAVFTVDAWIKGGTGGTTGGTIFGFGVCDFYSKYILDTQVAPPSRGEGSVLSIIYRGYYLLVEPVGSAKAIQLGYVSQPASLYGPGAGARWIQTVNGSYGSGWTHIAAIYGGENVNDSKIYVNGEECQYAGKYDTGPSDINYDKVYYGDDQVTLGIGPPTAAVGALGWDRYFGGRISSLKIYNRALTQEEIRTHYHTFQGRWWAYRDPFVRDSGDTPFNVSTRDYVDPSTLTLPDDLPP